MCGITGIVNADGSPPSVDLLERMTRRIAHRGPDDEAVRVFPSSGVGLGHRRLKVIDLAGGSQPMEDPETGNWTVYNGEIYNFKDLRKELEGKGKRFATQSDTEVLLKAYSVWGDEAVLRFNGMFAFAIWDPSRRTITLARDRIGKKPLYYFMTDRLFCFASELKALLCHPDCPGEVSLPALARYLFCEFVPAPHSIIDGVLKLEPATILKLDLAGFRISKHRYFHLPFPRSGHDVRRSWERDPKEATEALEERLERAVSRRLVSDVPLGVFLSGGIDSSTITALMAQTVPAGQIETFSIGFRDRTFDESGHARLIAAELGTNHHEEILDPRKVVEMLPRVMDVLDEPLGDASIVPTCLLSAFARRHVTVALGGDGGDEFWAGYPTFQAERLASFFYDWQPGPLRSFYRKAAGLLPVSTANISWDFKIKQFLKGADLNGPARHQVWLGSFDLEELRRILHPDRASELDPRGIIEEMRSAAGPTPTGDPMDELLAFYVRYYLSEDILVKVDRASMSVGLEVRAPFLDPEVIELACQVPPSLRMRRLVTKYLLKEAVRKLLPSEIIRRPKKGFGIPVARWLMTDLNPLMERLLDPERLARQGFLNAAEVVRLKQEHMSGKRDNRKQLWTLMVFMLWMERYKGAF